MKIKMMDTYCGKWLTIEQGFVQGDFTITERKPEPVTEKGADEISKHSRSVVAEVVLDMKPEVFEYLKDLRGKTPYDFMTYIDSLVRMSMYGKPPVLYSGVRKGFSLKGVSKASTKMVRYNEAVDNAITEFDPKALTKKRLEEFNESLKTAVDHANERTTRDNVDATRSPEWRDFADEKLDLGALRGKIDGLEEELKSLRSALNAARNEGMLKLFEGDLEWGAKDEDLQVRLPDPIIEGLRELFKEHKGFASNHPFRR